MPTLLEAENVTEQTFRMRIKDCMISIERKVWRNSVLAAAWVLLVGVVGLAGLARGTSPITTKVTQLNQWLLDAAGARFSFIRPVDLVNELEQQA